MKIKFRNLSAWEWLQTIGLIVGGVCLGLILSNMKSFLSTDDVGYKQVNCTSTISDYNLMDSTYIFSLNDSTIIIKHPKLKQKK